MQNLLVVSNSERVVISFQQNISFCFNMWCRHSLIWATGINKWQMLLLRCRYKWITRCHASSDIAVSLIEYTQSLSINRCALRPATLYRRSLRFALDCWLNVTGLCFVGNLIFNNTSLYQKDLADFWLKFRQFILFLFFLCSASNKDIDMVAVAVQKNVYILLLSRH